MIFSSFGFLKMIWIAEHIGFWIFHVSDLKNGLDLCGWICGLHLNCETFSYCDQLCVSFYDVYSLNLN